MKKIRKIRKTIMMRRKLMKFNIDHNTKEITMKVNMDITVTTTVNMDIMDIMDATEENTDIADSF
jgi:hypothetical protein